MQALNVVALVGRLTREPEITSTTEGTTIARWTLAVNRDKEGADFISCNAFGQKAEFVEKYIRKGMLVSVVGSIRTGSYTNKEGAKVYTTDIITNKIEFMEKKGDAPAETSNDKFMDVPTDMEEFPFA